MESVEDSPKFKNIPAAPRKDFSDIINSEKRVTDLLKKLKNENAISEETYNKLRHIGSNCGQIMDQLKWKNLSKMDYQHSDPFFQQLVPLHTNWQYF